MVRPEGVEPPTYWFVASCSIQLSYGRTLRESNFLTVEEIGYLSKPLRPYLDATGEHSQITFEPLVTSSTFVLELTPVG